MGITDFSSATFLPERGREERSGILIGLWALCFNCNFILKGATPSQYGFVFGIANMAAFLFAPIFGRYGTKIGLKLLYNTGSFVQSIAGILFGCLDYVQHPGLFLGLSYTLRQIILSCLLINCNVSTGTYPTCRFISGVADAAAIGAVLSILMKLFPNKVSTVVSWTEMSFGLGWMLGYNICLFIYKYNVVSSYYPFKNRPSLGICPLRVGWIYITIFQRWWSIISGIN